jgi:hypothetical protein
MNIQVIPRCNPQPPRVLNWEEGFSSHLELWVESAPAAEYKNISMLHRAGIFIERNLDKLTLEDIAYHILILFKGLDDLNSSAALRTQKNSMECVNKALNSINLLLQKKAEFKLDILMVAELSRLSAKFQTISALIVSK